MSVTVFESFLTTRDMTDVFSDASFAHAMFCFEAALARAQAAEGVIPTPAANAIANVCKAELHDVSAIVAAAGRAGSLAIPLVKELTRTVALFNEDAAGYVHWGSTSQDVIDTALALVTRDAVSLIERDLDKLIAGLLELAQMHADTPMLARTLMQPAPVISFGLKLVNWVAPLLRTRVRLRETASRALALQLGGAVGTLSAMGEQGPAVARRMATDLGLALPAMPWHTQRDEWVRLGMEIAVLVGNLGKIATDLSLLAQGEIGELAEPAARGRGGSSTMPHKRNPIASMVALAAATRVPARAAALLSAMSQQHERGLGNFQAEIAEWPGLFLSAHGAVWSLAEALGGLQVDSRRMLRNIEATQGLVFAEAVAMRLAATFGRVQAFALVEDLSAQAVESGRPFKEVVADAVASDANLQRALDPAATPELFDIEAAARQAGALTRERLRLLRNQAADLVMARQEHTDRTMLSV